MGGDAVRAECLVETYRSRKRTRLLRSEGVEVEALRRASFSFEKGSSSDFWAPTELVRAQL